MSPAKQTPEEKARANVLKFSQEVIANLKLIGDEEFAIRYQRLFDAWERAQQSKQ